MIELNPLQTAARWNNDYLVQQLETEFLLHQGDPSWLQGTSDQFMHLDGNTKPMTDFM